ncbi:hypothetical protein DICVIV_08278 [Dictyocaulus viviparus]|uniref:Uncharacterized protein n=1 Tax=Dictyocaulus viviparus TaxID=29172 RepID=A0A0D8XPH5_DICVI|nr:hypothetical protein DICVIV_08278 [Dictyocaulus viviparus]
MDHRYLGKVSQLYIQRMVVISTPAVNAGIIKDVELLLEAFKEKNSVRLVKFYEVVAEYELCNIYSGRLCVTELLEFAECLLKASFAYVRPIKESRIGPPSSRSLTEQIFGVYATYVLYYLQPIDYVSKIFVTPSDIKDVKHFITSVLLPGRHLDTVACLYKLFADDAFSIAPFVKCYDPVCCRRNDIVNCEEDIIDEDESYKPLEATKSIMEHPILKTMAHVQEEIEKKQKLIPGCPIVVDPENNFLVSINKIYNTMKSKIEALYNGEVVDSDTDEFSNVNEGNSPTVNKIKSPTRMSIKRKAYSSSVSYSRNRRYADPNMLENFPLEESATSADTPSTYTPRKKSKNVRNSRPSTSIAADEITISDDFSNEDSTHGSCSRMKTRKRTELLPGSAKMEKELEKTLNPTSTPVRKRKTTREVVNANTADIDECTVPGVPDTENSPKNTKTRTSQKVDKKKKSAVTSPTRSLGAISSESRDKTKKEKFVPKKPFGRIVDAAFEAEMKRIEDSLEEPEDERVKLLLGS